MNALLERAYDRAVDGVYEARGWLYDHPGATGEIVEGVVRGGCAIAAIETVRMVRRAPAEYEGLTPLAAAAVLGFAVCAATFKVNLTEPGTPPRLSFY